MVRMEENSKYKGGRSFRKEVMVSGLEATENRKIEVMIDWIVWIINTDAVDFGENSLRGGGQEPVHCRQKSKSSRGAEHIWKSVPQRPLSINTCSAVKGSQETGQLRQAAVETQVLLLLGRF